MGTYRLGVDVGGTFTDLVAIGGGEVVTAKVPSTPDDQSRGAATAIEHSAQVHVAAWRCQAVRRTITGMLFRYQAQLK